MECTICSKSFVGKHEKQLACSRSCNAVLQNKIKSKLFVPPSCKQCKKVMPVRSSRQKFCNASCQHAWSVGPNNPMWKGGKTLRQDGYVYIRINGKYVLEHRYVMEKFIGRTLLKKEVVHHKNGIQSDNRVENLELLTSQALHLQEHNFWKEEQKIAKQKNDSPL